MIERASLDGSARKVIIEEDNAHWPNGLSLDLPAGRLYWADARTDDVQSCNLHGKDLKARNLVNPNSSS